MTTANQRLKGAWTACLAGSTLCSLAVHWAIVGLVQPWEFPLRQQREESTTFVQLIPISTPSEALNQEPKAQEVVSPFEPVEPEVLEEEWVEPVVEWIPVMATRAAVPSPRLEPSAVSALPSPERVGANDFVSPIAWPQIANPERMNAHIRGRYNPMLAADSLRGVVVLTLWVDEKGAVNRVRLTESSGATSLDEIAVTTFEQVVTFSPARHAGRALPVQFNLAVPFLTAW